MAADHLLVRVEIVSGRGEPLDPAPGRIFLVGPGHSFEELGDSINHAFARWDQSPPFLFQLADGRQIGWEAGPGTEDAGEVEVLRTVKPGDAFSFIFDPHEDWAHRCLVEAEPFDLSGDDDPPPIPVPVYGWGTIPDQFGRNNEDDEAEDDDHAGHDHSEHGHSHD